MALTASHASQIIDLVHEIASRYQIASLEPLIQVCRSAESYHDLSIAVLGRFKAGKSSFLNHFVGRTLLPVGVTPVTSVITELLWGPEDRGIVEFLDGSASDLHLADIEAYVAEVRNPENKKRVSRVRVYVPDLVHLKGIRFVDTPGLDSAFSHNTDTSMGWVPNVDLALVAIGVDPPLAQQDVVLIRKLLEYTPKVCVLLTKTDILTERESLEVLQFVHQRLNDNVEQHIPVFPYSTRPGFETLRASLQRNLVVPILETMHQHKAEIIAHKLQTLVRECTEYLQLALRSAESMDSEREQFRRLALEQRKALADTKTALQLIARHSISSARSQIEQILSPYELTIRKDLQSEFEREYPTWRMGFAVLLERFKSWLRDQLTARLRSLSESRRDDLLQPLRDVERQYATVLQGFRDRLSARTMELFGVPLQTSETAMTPETPRSPDIHIGRIFDHNFEFLSPLIPVKVIRHPLRRHFTRRLDDETFKNLSRLTTQWADIVSEAAIELQRKAEHRLQELVQTVETLTTSTPIQAPEVAADLHRLQNTPLPRG